MPQGSGNSTRKVSKVLNDPLHAEFRLEPVPVSPGNAACYYRTNFRAPPPIIQDIEIAAAVTNWCMLLVLNRVWFTRILIYGHGQYPLTSGLISAGIVI